MNPLKGSKLAKAAVFTLGLTALPLSIPAFSQTTPPPPDRPVVTTRDYDEDRDWSWLGLLGLLGLAGLLGLRQTKHERVVTHSTSSTQRP